MVGSIVPKSKMIALRVEPDVLRDFRRRAKSQRKTMATWLRDLGLADARPADVLRVVMNKLEPSKGETQMAMARTRSTLEHSIARDLYEKTGVDPEPEQVAAIAARMRERARELEPPADIPSIEDQLDEVGIEMYRKIHQDSGVKVPMSVIFRLIEEHPKIQVGQTELMERFALACEAVVPPDAGLDESEDAPMVDEEQEGW